MSFRLVLAGPDTILPITLEGAEWLVGSAKDAGIRIDDPLVSRRHALLWLSDGRMYVRDIAARNTTRINDVALDGESEIHVGDRLLFGSTVAELHQLGELRARVVHGASDLEDTLQACPIDEDAIPGARIDLLGELTCALSPVQRADDAAQLALGLLFRHLPLQRALVARVGHGESLRVIASTYENASTEPIAVTRGMLSHLRAQQEPVCVRDASRGNGSQTAHFVAIAAPILTHGRLTGLLYLERRSSERCSAEELEIVRRVSKILASRIQTLDLLDELRVENAELKRTARASMSFLGISEPIVALKKRASKKKSPHGAVAICGETGAGKRAFAHWLHTQIESRTDSGLRRFTIVDCASCDDDPLDVILRSAVSKRADSSDAMQSRDETLCLLNVIALPKKSQRVIARACHRGEATSDGEPVGLRLIFTHSGSAKDLLTQLSSELATLVRDDVFEVPPLRKRVEDMPILTAFFLEAIAIEIGTVSTTVSPRAMDRLMMYDWPRNVAELRQTLKTAVILAGGRPITPKHLPKTLVRSDAQQTQDRLPSLEDVERAHIEKVLEALGGNKSLASKCLGIANSTLYQKMKRYGIGG